MTFFSRNGSSPCPPIPKHIGNSALLKRLNRSIVLTLLRQHSGLSRKALTQLTALDGKTITNVTQDLLKLGLIKAIGKVSRGVGRPREIIELNAEHGFALGIDVGASHISGVAVDFSGIILTRAYRTIHYGIKPTAVVERMISLGEHLLEEVNIPRKRLLGIGTCVPGTLDREAGVGIWAANLAEWRNVPLRKPLQEALKAPFFLEESTRCAALGEMFARVQENLTDFLLLDLSLGIGSALVQNGSLYYGHTGIAGEIGHTTVKPDGHECRCGKRGCLETEASGYAIARKFQEAIMNNTTAKKTICGGSEKTLSSKPTCPKPTWSAKDIAEEAQRGDSFCESLFTDAASLLGTAAANAVMLLNPAHLILMGGLTQSGDLLLRPFRETLRKELIPEILENLTVEISPLGDDAGPLGAASLVLNRIYDAPGMIEN